MIDRILASVQVVHDEISIGIDQNEESDVAGIRLTTERDPASTPSAEAPEPLATENSTIMSNIMVLDRPTPTNVQGVNISAIQEAISTTVTSRVPYNEFTENDVLFYSAFPHLFPLGRGIPSTGTVPEVNVKHMLNQFSNQFVKSSQLIFLLFNQKQRHQVAQSVKARVMSNPESFERFSTTIADDDFQARLTRAAENPAGPEARQVLRETLPFMKLCGGKVAYSPIERNESITNLYALVQRFSIPSFFLTLSQDDVHSPMTVRMCIPSIDNTSFPASDEGFLEAMQTNQHNFQTIDLGKTINLNQPYIGEYDLQKLVANNPVASSAIYNETVNAIFEVIVGLPFSNSIRKTTPFSTKTGAYGKVSATYIVTEVQGRKTLHGHS